MCAEEVAHCFLENGFFSIRQRDSSIWQCDKIMMASGIDTAATVSSAIQWHGQAPWRYTGRQTGTSLKLHAAAAVRHALCHICPLLTLDVTTMVAHSIMSSHQHITTWHTGKQQAACGTQLTGPAECMVSSPTYPVKSSSGTDLDKKA